MKDKVVIVGTGFVGATSAYALMMNGVAEEIVLLDVNRDKAEGEVMDLNHGILFVPPVQIRTGDYSDCKDARLIIISAGANQKPGESRMDLLKRNASIFKDIVAQISKYLGEAIILVVTNPVDVLTYFTLRVSGLPSSRVLGSGTVLDSSRFRFLLSRHCGVDARNVHAYIIGEHGDSEVPVWSLADIAGMPIDSYCLQCGRRCAGSEKEAIFREVRDSAYNIISKKGATYYAVGLAVRRITEAILRNENSVLTVSTLVEDYYGIKDVCLSLPNIVNEHGAAKLLEIPLNEREISSLKQSAEKIRQAIQQLGL
ncbi:L-lactate dehydrogenase [Mahella australiensis]|uniref:L-lactate dehydrogenase n=1 Tax=Mahella australiensis (strain DSM 15567 / CIP 107919 / 50-1 BON) TaxID=697281 RepID=F3ZYV6_MAHA5|nr:L-lactate dehydrogenase [Mahella australiensis]AEE95701.1 L-lactate dehydrogenase [Mahella australiensis 50-1 BON]